MSNYFVWKDYIQIELMAEFGNLVRMLEERVGDRPITVEDIFPLPELGRRADVETHAELTKLALRQRIEAIPNISKMIGTILRSVDDSILMRLRSRPGYEALINSADLAGVYATIKETVLGDRSAQVAESIRLGGKFANTRQGGRPLAEYVDELVQLRRQMAAVGRIISDDDMKYHLLLHLDNGGFAATAAEWVSRGSTPASFDEAVSILSRMEKLSRAQKGKVSDTTGADTVFVGSRFKGECWVCGSEEHRAAQCPDRRTRKKSGGSVKSGGTGTEGVSVSKPKPRPAW